MPADLDCLWCSAERGSALKRGEGERRNVKWNLKGKSFRSKNINVSTVRRFANTGNETVDILLEEIVNILISIVPLILYFIEYFVVAYYRGTGVSLLQGGWEMSLNNSLGFPFMMGSSVGISTYLSRKTGNIWSGIFTATLILGIFTITAPLMAG